MDDMSFTAMLDVSMTLGVALALPLASLNGVVMRDDVCDVVLRLQSAVGLSATPGFKFSMEMELRLSIRLSVEIQFRLGSGPRLWGS